jgi:5S rRNA maturation endonuclease (ribonuclease M5)
MKPPDVFTEAQRSLTIPEAWVLLGLPGEPRPSCRSPFREEKTPSFSIHSEGTKWTDHGNGTGGDVIEFIRTATGLDHKEVRQWLIDRLNLDQGPAKAPAATARPSQTTKSIKWPSPLVEGTEATWKAFAAKRGMTYPGAWVAVKSGILRFALIDGAKCYVITDAERRAAEIRRIDGKMFGTSKAFPLSGVDKRWLPGAALLRQAKPYTAVLVVEGATDLLSAIDLCSRYAKADPDHHSWIPVAVLGANCKALDPECANLISGRHVRLVPDADEAGDKMRDHWTEVFRANGCTVDHVTLPRGTDLSDHLNTITPSDLFAL